jgi:HD-GYP domain-containing protein (c-di-GMP phosphodiesterase class II)
LTDDDCRVVKERAAIGADEVADMAPAFRVMSEGIRSRQERWDGKGYGRGPTGQEIALMGRILAVVGAFEATTSARPYRGARDA